MTATPMASPCTRCSEFPARESGLCRVCRCHDSCQELIRQTALLAISAPPPGSSTLATEQFEHVLSLLEDFKLALQHPSSDENDDWSHEDRVAMNIRQKAWVNVAEGLRRVVPRLRAADGWSVLRFWHASANERR